MKKNKVFTAHSRPLHFTFITILNSSYNDNTNCEEAATETWGG